MDSHSLIVTDEDAKLRLDVFLTQNLPEVPSRSFIQKLIESGCVTVNETFHKSHYKVLAGDEIFVNFTDVNFPNQDLEPEEIPLDIIYEDAQILGVNKPSGMLVHPASGIYKGTLANALLFHCKKLSDINSNLRPGIVHRLDRDTSGILLVAKDNKSHGQLAKQFEEHSIQKRYVALVEGLIEFDEGLVDAPLGRHPFHREKKTIAFDEQAKYAQTFYRVIKRLNNMTAVALFPQTGRTHQLRVHMMYLGHPILGDEKYGKKHLFPRLALHAQSIGFVHPKTKHYLEFSVPLPKDFISQIKVVQ